MATFGREDRYEKLDKKPICITIKGIKNEV
jgi:hypothetical protein